MECGWEEEDPGLVHSAECPLVLVDWASCLISVSWLLYLCNRDSIPFGCCADKLNSFLQNSQESVQGMECL